MRLVPFIEMGHSLSRIHSLDFSQQHLQGPLKVSVLSMTFRTAGAHDYSNCSAGNSLEVVSRLNSPATVRGSSASTTHMVHGGSSD